MPSLLRRKNGERGDQALRRPPLYRVLVRKVGRLGVRPRRRAVAARAQLVAHGLRADDDALLRDGVRVREAVVQTCAEINNYGLWDSRRVDSEKAPGYQVEYIPSKLVHGTNQTKSSSRSRSACARPGGPQIRSSTAAPARPSAGWRVDAVAANNRKVTTIPLHYTPYGRRREGGAGGRRERGVRLRVSTTTLEFACL